MFLAAAQQHGDVLGLHDVPFAEDRPLGYAGDNLGDVVAEHLPHGILGGNEFHGQNLLGGTVAGRRRR